MVFALCDQYRPNLLAAGKTPAPPSNQAELHSRHLLKPETVTLCTTRILSPPTATVHALTPILGGNPDSAVACSANLPCSLQAHEARVVYVDGICCLVPEGSPNNLNKGFGEDRRFGHFWQNGDTGYTHVKRQTGLGFLTMDLRRSGKASSGR
jgi:hypothetical protein